MGLRREERWGGLKFVLYECGGKQMKEAYYDIKIILIWSHVIFTPIFLNLGRF